MELPVKFKEKIQGLLQDEFEAYLDSYSFPEYQGIRINTLKLGKEAWDNICPFEGLEAVSWCKEGYYYQEGDRPGKHPYYHAGLYYMQEPSAMAPGAYIPIEEGDKVLDLCAAPGGKSTQVGARLGQTGLLVSNDISATRAMALMKNIENFGIRNSMITAETSERLATKFKGYFNKILIDAPCSGEGMFRKNENAVKSWETHGIEHCCNLQRIILEDAYTMLKTDGMMLYSTCTFSPEENEGMIEAFLEKHPDCQIIPLTGVGGIKQGRPEWSDSKKDTLSGALRLWPHHLKGEGHFVCLIQKLGEAFDETKRLSIKKRIKDIPILKEFIETNTHLDINTPIIELKNKIYLQTEDAPDLEGLRVIRSGMYLGEVKNKRFDPSQVLALAYPKEMFKNYIDLQIEDANVIKYLKGETLLIEAPKGFNVIGVMGHPLGWVKSQNGTLKNLYATNWRMM
ncbi:RsmF rRNA methyltransferase first C-terminal domain-containing protein [Niameybacter massiliensis]|uniref:RsmF rRNA methyltransferase first C-terminal domain-containing protein n=1 Tax=Niameybacter massiliensis TaxID=1658108 RepID=UPI0006B67198|nr:RsmB/NOP family class I SAM-dependent RNA methyltransferase [Niameybacter massiliensis]